jgi:nitroimidazol reductase NimA-like FMN-containing flavoprotein (pyridoxamine 5'-phosphate oxidase superfamily)
MEGDRPVNTPNGPTPSSGRTTVKRNPHRGRYDRETVDAIFDDALICHVGFVADGAPFVIPTIHARVGDVLYFHGSPASRMLRLMKKGAEVCVTATLVDSIVVARSVFNHSLGFRSAMVIGPARVVDSPDEKTLALEAITEAVLPGRWEEARHPTRNEDKGTLVVAVDIEEFSAKVRGDHVADEPADYDLPIWAGSIPLTTRIGAPVPDPELVDGIDVPGSVRRFTGTA